MINVKNLLSFFVFSGSKSLVFFTPLAILWLLGDDYYVQVEQTFATSLLLWPMLALGMTSAYSYFFLEKKDDKFTVYYYRYLLVILSITALIAIGMYALDTAALDTAALDTAALDTRSQKDHLLHISFVVFLMCFSYFLSVVHKCRSDVIRSSSLDALPYVVFFLFLISVTWYEQLGTVFLISTVAFMLLYVAWLSQRQNNQYKAQHTTNSSLSKEDITLYFSKGIHSFIVGWIAITVVMFPRVFTAEYASIEESKSLYLALRFGTFFVLIYQFLQIKLYSTVFKLSATNMKKILFAYWCVLFITLAVLVLLQLSLPYYFAVLYTGMWIMVSMLELQVVRFGVQMSVVKGALLLSPILAMLFFLDNFYHFILFSITLLSLYLSVQAYAVYKAKYALQIMALPLISAMGLLYYA